MNVDRLLTGRHGRRAFLAVGGLSVLAACTSDDSSSDPTEPAAGSEPPETATAGDAEPGETMEAATDTVDPVETDPSPAAPATDPATIEPLAPADFDGLATCTLHPEAAAGPFGLPEQFVRRDITEGYEGHPLRLGIRVVDGACAPVAGVSVEVWHADATGDYSAFTDGGSGKDEGDGTTFMRGTQPVDESGIAEFATVYPGWYGGRTPHIHVRVHRGGDLAHTGQLYFDDSYSDAVYGTGVYAEFGPADTTNATDGLAGDPAAEGTLLALEPTETTRGTGTLALVNLGLA